jgi:hypothetical protein
MQKVKKFTKMLKNYGRFVHLGINLGLWRLVMKRFLGNVEHFVETLTIGTLKSL